MTLTVGDFRQAFDGLSDDTEVWVFDGLFDGSIIPPHRPVVLNGRVYLSFDHDAGFSYMPTPEDVVALINALGLRDESTYEADLAATREYYSRPQNTLPVIQA